MEKKSDKKKKAKAQNWKKKKIQKIDRCKLCSKRVGYIRPHVTAKNFVEILVQR